MVFWCGVDITDFPVYRGLAIHFDTLRKTWRFVFCFCCFELPPALLNDRGVGVQWIVHGFYVNR